MEPLFQAHLELLRLFLAHREDIVESIEAGLNAQRKPIRYLQDRALLSRHCEDCFFARTAANTQTRLRGQLEEAHWAAGFRPRRLQGMFNDLIHPAEMMIRGFHFWRQTHWPGRNGRIHYAHTLFNVYLIRCLELLSLRLWDGDPSDARGRLAELQGVLDDVWRSSPADQPVILRDARWLIPLAQSMPTDELVPYLTVARRVATTLGEADALEIQKAQVRMLGGHLTSQIRHHCMRDGAPIDDSGLVLRTRTSNALDFALLVQGLVALLKAYECAVRSGEERLRFDLAGAVFQGMSPDPELFLHRVDLLSAYTMIEHVFIAQDVDGQAAYSTLGRRHVQLLDEYRGLIGRLTRPLRDDLPRHRPLDGGYSPYGAVFGYPSTLTELMALKTLERDAETRFSLEDVFDERDTGAAKLAWVDGLRKMPHVDPEVQRLYGYPQQFAEDIFGRIEREFEAADASRTGRLYIVSGDGPERDLLARYFRTPDRAQLQHERQEGHYLVSYETPAGWIGLSKDLLTEVLGAGRDARIGGLTRDAAQVLRLMCAGLLGS